MNTEKNYYKILGLTNQAEVSEIKKAYKQLALKLHPDKTQGDKVKEEQFKSVSEAYSILSDGKKKQKYDQMSQHGRNYVGGGNPFGGDPFGGFGAMTGNPFDIFKDIFGQHNPFEREGNVYHEFHENLDIQVNVVISLRDVYKAEPIKIKYDRRVHCKKCNGTGFDRDSHSDSCEMCDGTGKDEYGRKCEYCQGLGKIYSGTCTTCNGEKLVSDTFEFKLNAIENVRESKTQYLQDYGHQSKYFRNKRGTLIMNVVYKHVKGYELKKGELYYDLDVHYQDAIDGKKVEYEHLDNKKFKVKIPKKTKDGDIIKIKEKGLVITGTKKRRDMYFKLNIIVDYDRQ